MICLIFCPYPNLSDGIFYLRQLTHHEINRADMNTQYKSPHSATTYVCDPVDVVSTARTPWRGTPFRRLPWLGLGALLGAVLGVIASIAILMKSNGQPTEYWTLQPTIYLAIALTVTNILLHFALAEAVSVAWWRRATQEQTKVNDLHRHWSYGNNLWAAVRSGKHVNMVAIA